jgi:hypothetical protein
MNKLKEIREKVKLAIHIPGIGLVYYRCTSIVC